jgi:tRNA pseudouridine55 synthase
LIPRRPRRAKILMMTTPSKTDGCILFYKKAGLTSFEALTPLKKALPRKTKVGHTGTLDKFAEGLMLVLTGRLTRLNPLLSGFDKAYRAVIAFGAETDTLDPEGMVIKTAPLPAADSLAAVLESFTGLQEQIPPVYSAIHINGERASARARSGEQVAMPTRSVSVYKIDLIAAEHTADGRVKAITIDVSCSKGTYIRSLARDIGRRLHSAASLTALTRTGTGIYREEVSSWAFSADEAVTAADFLPEKHLISAVALSRRLPGVSGVTVKEEYSRLVENGNKPEESWFTAKPEGHEILIFDRDQKLLAAAGEKGGQWSYRFVCAN